MAPKHTQTQAQSALQFILGIFWECIHGAWTDYRDEYSPEIRLHHSARTRSSAVYDHAVARLEVHLASVPGASIVRYRGLTLIVVADDFVIKFPKKLGRRRLSNTYPTTQTLGFLTQDESIFPFLSERTSLIVGYLLNELGTAIEAVYVTCPDGPTRNHWWFEVENPNVAVGTIGPNSPLPFSPFDSDEDTQEVAE